MAGSRRIAHVWAAWAAVVVLVCAGCNSTNRIAAEQASSDVESVTAPSVDPAAGPEAGSETITRQVGGDAPSGANSTTGGGGEQARLGRGVTATNITIGFNITKNLGAALTAVGFSGGQETEERPIVEALVAHMNANGGLAGRKIVPVFFEYEATSVSGWDALATAACSTFIEDNDVFAVVSGHVGQTDSLLACLAAGGVPLVQQNQWPYDGEYFSRYAGYLYQPSRMRPERWVPEYIAGLAQAGYFDAGFKLGLVRFDAPVFVRIERMIRDQLEAQGVGVLTDVAVIRTPQSVGQFSGMAAQLSNAILQFRSKGVTHVIFDEYASIIPYFFLAQAESQGYRPRYGLTSMNLPGTLEQQHGKAQLGGAVAVSWLPGQDSFKDGANDPRAGRGGNYDLCMQIVRDAIGIPPSRLYTPLHCDNLLFLDAALSSTNDLTASGLLAAVEGLGHSYDSPYTWSTQFGPGRTDGASRTMLGLYHDDCECFRFSGELRPAR